MKPDIIDLAATSPATAGIIVRQARELGYDKLFVKTGGAGMRDILEVAGPKAAEGTINALWANPANEGFRRLATTYKASRGQEPNEMIAPVFDGVNILFKAIQQAGTIEDTKKVADSFHKAFPFKTVQGDEIGLGGVNINGTHREVRSVTFIGVIRDGQFAVIGKAE